MSIDVITLDIVEKQILVGEAKLSIVDLLGLDVAVVEIMHLELREIENCKQIQA